MNRLFSLILILVAGTFFTGNAQYYTSESAFKKAWPEYIGKTGFWGNSYSSYRYYVGDINGDDRNDIISIVQTYRGDNANDRVLGMGIELSRGPELYKRITVPAFSPFQGYDAQAPEGIYLADITKEANQLVFHFKDKRYSWYLRKITIGYNKANNQLEIAKDGGVGVATAINEEKFYVPLERNLEDFNWDAVNEFIPQLATAEKRKSITVKTKDEFFAALGDHRDIILDMDVLDLSMHNTKKYYKNLADDAQGVGASGVFNYYTDLTITGKEHTDVLVDNTLDDVWSMNGCKLITLSNLNFYHIVPADAVCEGLVAIFNDCKYITLRDCQFNGSGMIGIDANNVTNLTVENCKIYNNSAYAISLYKVKHSSFKGTEIYKNQTRNELLSIAQSQISFENCTIRDNQTNDRIINMPSNANANNLSFKNTRFFNNKENNEQQQNFYFPGKDKSTFVLDESFASDDEIEGEPSIESVHLYVDGVEVANSDDVATAATAAVEDPITEEQREYFMKQAIRNFIGYEDARDMSGILNSFATPVNQYWEQKNPTKSYLEKTYRLSWTSLSKSKNDILGIRKLGSNRYLLHTMFSYTVAKTKKQESKDSYLEFTLNDNYKITSVKPSAAK